QGTKKTPPTHQRTDPLPRALAKPRPAMANPMKNTVPETELTRNETIPTLPDRRSARRQKQIEAMLYRLRDAMDETAGTSESRADALESRLLVFPASFNAALRELDRCLSRLGRTDRHLHWHVRAWYVDLDWRQETQHRWVIVAGKRRKLDAGWKMTPRRHPDALEQRALAGVDWIAEAYRFDQIHLKDLAEATGESP